MMPSYILVTVFAIVTIVMIVAIVVIVAIVAIVTVESTEGRGVRTEPGTLNSRRPTTFAGNIWQLTHNPER